MPHGRKARSAVEANPVAPPETVVPGPSLILEPDIQAGFELVVVKFAAVTSEPFKTSEVYGPVGSYPIRTEPSPTFVSSFCCVIVNKVIRSYLGSQLLGAQGKLLCCLADLRFPIRELQP